MIARETVENNRASWQMVLDDLDEYPQDGYWIAFLAFMREVLQGAIGEGLNDYFRAGQSMHHIIFSTCERHRLEGYDPPPLRVTLEFSKELGASVATSHANLWFHPAEKKDPVTAETALPVLKTYLAHLWRETRANEPLPEPLASFASHGIGFGLNSTH